MVSTVALMRRHGAWPTRRHHVPREDRINNGQARSARDVVDNVMNLRFICVSALCMEHVLAGHDDQLGPILHERAHPTPAPEGETRRAATGMEY